MMDTILLFESTMASSSAADASAATSWFDKSPTDMSMKELKLAICNAGLRNESVGFLEKSEFVGLLTSYLNDVHGQDECPVCFTAMNFDMKSILLSCKHRMCEDCLGSIVTRDDVSCSCPLCRASVSDTSLAIGLKGASLVPNAMVFGGYDDDNDSKEIVDRCERQLREALRRDPYNAGLMSALADVVLNKKKDIDQAEMLSRRAVCLEPSNPFGFASLGNVYRAMGNMPECLRCLEKAVSLKEDPNFMVNLGITQSTLGNHEAALATLRRSLEIAPKNMMALLNLGVMLLKRDIDIEIDESIRVLERALEVDAVGSNIFPPGAFYGRISEALVDAIERKAAK